MTSPPGVRIAERLVADANVVLSAVAGKAALRVFTASSIQIVSTQEAIEDVEEYLPIFSKKYDIAVQALDGQLRLLAIKPYGLEAYRHHLAKAQRMIGKRDPDDAPLLALALALESPIWTNDHDFEETGVVCYTTARLLRHLHV